LEDFLNKDHRHIRRIIKKERIAAVEIHRQMTNKRFQKYFNINTVNLVCKNEFTVLSYKNQLQHSIIDNQINNKGNKFGFVNLKNIYDVFLLSYKCNTYSSIKENNYLFNILNSFLLSASYILNKPKKIIFEKNKKSNIFNRKVLFNIENPKKLKKKLKINRLRIFVKNLPKVFLKRKKNKNYRKYFLKKIKNKKWQQEKLIQLGLKKSKSSS